MAGPHCFLLWARLVCATLLQVPVTTRLLGPAENGHLGVLVSFHSTTIFRRAWLLLSPSP